MSCTVYRTKFRSNRIEQHSCTKYGRARSKGGLSLDKGRLSGHVRRVRVSKPCNNIYSKYKMVLKFWY